MYYNVDLARMVHSHIVVEASSVKEARELAKSKAHEFIGLDDHDRLGDFIVVGMKTLD